MMDVEFDGSVITRTSKKLYKSRDEWEKLIGTKKKIKFNIFTDAIYETLKEKNVREIFKENLLKKLLSKNLK